MTRYYLDTFTIFRGTVIAEGWCENFHPKLYYDGNRIKIGFCKINRPDLVPIFGKSSEQWGFRLTAVLPEYGIEHEKLLLALNSKTKVQAPATAFRPADAAFAAMRETFRSEVARRGGSLVEIGSRSRSGIDYRDWFPANIRYVGVDITAGDNVDVVADAHHLTGAIDERFDFAFSMAVFEHLLMPWKVALELNGILNDRALGLIVSHGAWPLHEEPWDFWRYSKEAWRGIFNKHTGFEVIAAEYEHPASIVPRFAGSGPLRGIDGSATFLMSGCLVRKIGPPLVRWDAQASEVYDLSYSHR
ncbi:MAG: methyltransferase type 11 [Methylobacterium frigidaeris]